MSAIDYAKQLRTMYAADPVLTAMLNCTGPSWADLMQDEYPETEASLQLFKERQQAAAIKYMADQERAAALKAALEAKMKAEIQEDIKYLEACWASEDYWSANHCTCSQEVVEDYIYEEGKPCACYQKIHLGADGMPEECRFFNSPAGCRDGSNCFYKHVERDPATIPCRFEQSSAGCVPSHGRRCPYMHVKPRAPINTVPCRFNFKCKARECPYKHGF